MTCVSKKKQHRAKSTLNKTPELISDISIVLAGEAGQGIQSIETILVNVMKRAGYRVFATKEYMSRVRGGVNSTQIRISTKRVSAWIERTDLLIPLDKASFTRLEPRIQSSTMIVGEKETLGDNRVLDVGFTAIASRLGDPVYASMVAVGVVCGILGTAEQVAKEFIEKQFGRKGEKVVADNLQAFSHGLREGQKIMQSRNNRFASPASGSMETEVLLSGADAAALGAIAGGCDSVFAYPMTPSTGVFTALAGFAETAGLVVEQVEDEIGVINMALGSWYAGGRALATTSGGGFSLMTEGISLSGMTETPVVVLVSQRPGPATGLPTRTEQGDLNLVLYAGHGVFPRIILAPGDTRQTFELTARAFELADRFQVPVFVLTDQYLVDSYYNIPLSGLPVVSVKKHIIESTPDYKRYSLTRNGLSPRGVPGFGSGTVCSDSDEHDEEGRITEDLSGMSLAMKDKRSRKSRLVEADAIPPELFGPKTYRILFVGWGSVKNTVIEALEHSGIPHASFLHFSQVYPIAPKALKYLEKADRIVMIENNQTGQFEQLLKRMFGTIIRDRILRYDGMQFSVESLVAEMKKTAGGKS
jgi:2-oxoglutarate ferredoxin oxidoreductase subunit alpha